MLSALTPWIFSHKRLDGFYYISRVLIPPLERIFNLVGADVRGWYEEMPKAMRADQPDPILLSPRKDSSNVNRFKIDEHFNSLQCINCGTLAFDRKALRALLLSLYVLSRRDLRGLPHADSDHNHGSPEAQEETGGATYRCTPGLCVVHGVSSL